MLFLTVINLLHFVTVILVVCNYVNLTTSVHRGNKMEVWFLLDIVCL